MHTISLLLNRKVIDKLTASLAVASRARERLASLGLHEWQVAVLLLITHGQETDHDNDPVDVV